MENQTPKEENQLNPEKLTYKKDLWMYFDIIKDKFYFDRNKAKTLLYIISQKNDIDYEYSENLKYLFNQFITQFDTYEEHIKSKNIDPEKNTLNKAIKCLINDLKYESELYLNHTKNILEKIIRPLEGFIMSQCEIINEFTTLMKSYENDFMNVNKQIEQKQINFFQGGKSVESAINKLEIYKNQIKENDNNENENTAEINNDEDEESKMEEEENRKEMIEGMSEILEKNKISARQLQLDYQDYIIKANAEREKYIKGCENLYDKVQHLDEEFLNVMKAQLISITQNKLNLIENIKVNISKALKLSNEINIENDINLFINSKITKFNPPKKFEYVDYNPYKILRNRKGHTDAFQSEISSKIIECLKQIYTFEKQPENLHEEENINFINETTNDIWDCNNFDKNRLELLFKEHIYRMSFLRMLNQYRIEGIFILKETSFQNFCMVLTSLLDKSLIDNDYECIKFCMILSQTFYLQAEKKILLQSCMTLNPIWKDKNFWEKMIEFSINDEINNSKEYTIFLNEDSKSRQKRVESAVMSNLITFLFNMKLFGYPEEDGRVVVDEFIQKYNIDGNLIYATNISIKDIKDDIIIESIDTIINNDIKNNNENNIIQKDDNKDNNNNKTQNENIIDNENDNVNKVINNSAINT